MRWVVVGAAAATVGALYLLVRELDCSRWTAAIAAATFGASYTFWNQSTRVEVYSLHVLLVCPGPIRRDDAGTRYEQAAGVPAAARQPGGGVKLKGIDPDWLARRVLLACQRREVELVIPARARLLFAIAALWPRLGDWIVQRMMKRN